MFYVNPQDVGKPALQSKAKWYQLYTQFFSENFWCAGKLVLTCAWWNTCMKSAKYESWERNRTCIMNKNDVIVVDSTCNASGSISVCLK